MYGYIYKTTNLINGKIYIGQKKAQKFVETYKGSGKYLQRALKKYGENNFATEIIEWCETYDLLNEREKYWIGYYEDKNYQMYNIAKGAVGGDTFYKLSEEDRQKRIKKLKQNGYFTIESEEDKKKRLQKTHQTRMNNGNYKMSEEQKQKLSKSLIGRKIPRNIVEKIANSNRGKKRTIETKNKISRANKGKKLTEDQKLNVSKGLKEYYKTHENPFKGKTHTEDSKRRISENCKGITLNTIWVNNGQENKRITETELNNYIEKGYMKGRLKFAYPKNRKSRGPCSEELKKKISEGNKGKQTISKEQRQKMVKSLKEKLIGSVRVGKNGEYKYIKPEEIEQYLSQGFELSERGKQVYGK